MSKSWSKDEIHEVLSNATPIVRKFLYVLAKKGSTTMEEVGVHHLAAVIGLRYSTARKKEPLYSAAPIKGSRSKRFTIVAKYRPMIAAFFRANPGMAKAPAVVAKPRTKSSRKAAANVAKASAKPPQKKTVAKPAKARPAKSAPASIPAPRTAPINGFVALGPDASRNLSFWTDLVAFANKAAKAGKELRVASAGSGWRIEAGK